MSFQITEAFVVQFTAGMTLRAQQMESRLRDTATIEDGVRGTSVDRDFVGRRRPQARTTRHGDTQYRDTPHDRRWCDLVVYDDADLIDQPDMVRTLTDPTNPYTAAMAAGFGRLWDEVLMDGAVGTTRTGVDGTSSSSAPTSVLTEGGVLGLTLAKMISNKRLLDAAEQPTERFWAITARQVEDMLNINEVRSSDYNTLRVLAEGQINSYMGYSWRRVESPILKLRSGTVDKRRTVIWTRPAVMLAFGTRISSSIDRLPTKNNSTQIFYSSDFGACRMDDAGVIVQECHEA